MHDKHTMNSNQIGGRRKKKEKKRDSTGITYEELKRNVRTKGLQEEDFGTELNGEEKGEKEQKYYM